MSWLTGLNRCCWSARRYFSMIIVGCLAAIAGPVSGATLNVDNQDPACSDVTGTPYCTIGAAFSAAVSGADDIAVAPGTYSESIEIFPQIVDIFSTDGPDVTTIEASPAGTGRIFGINSGSLRLRGFTLTGGNASPGGAIWVNSTSGTLNLEDAIVIGNTSTGDGGGIANWGTTNISGSTISGNSGTFGGGIDNAGTMTIVDSIIVGNTANFGAGIFHSENSLGIAHTLDIVGTTIDGNDAAGFGGGLYVISENGAAANTVTIDRSTISNNDGIGIYAQGSSVPASPAATVDLVNSTVSGNVGDGIVADELNAIVSLSFVTITANTGNGVTARPGDPGGVVGFGGSIIAANGGVDCSRVGLTGFVVSSGFNLIGDVAGCDNFAAQTGDQVGGAGVPVINPLLGPLEDNGGLTFTHAPNGLSTAVDAAGTTCSVAVDQRGVDRPLGAGCDIGAVEIAIATPLQDLIDAAAPGATVIVPDGTYTEAITLDNEGIVLQGSGPDSVIIDASGQGTSAVNALQSFTMIGMRITGGNSPGQGGGINTPVFGDILVTLENVRIDNNSAATVGGGIHLEAGSDLVMTNVQIDNNTAGVRGGGLFFDSFQTVTMDGVQIIANEALQGGGIYSEFTDIFIGTGVCALAPTLGSVQANLIADNAALGGVDPFTSEIIPGDGGAIFNRGDLQITDTRFRSNNAAANGGGIYQNSAGGVINTQCSVFETNQAIDGSGGGAAILTGLADFTSVLFSSNTAGDQGGAISGRADIDSSILEFNTANNGGGAAALDSGIVNDSTFFSNFAPFGNGGAVLWNTPGGLQLGNLYDSNRSNGNGGAIAARGVISLDEVFIGNLARNGGGAISLLTFFPTGISVSGGTFTDNQVGEGGLSVSGRGGAIENTAGTLQVVDSQFFGNSAPESGDGQSQGGAIYSNGTNVALTDSRFSSSSAGDGGALFIEGAATLSGVTLSDNSVSDASAAPFGAAIASTGVLDIVNTTLSGNVFNPGPGNSGGGAAIALLAGSATVNNVSFVDNIDGQTLYGAPGTSFAIGNSLFNGNVDNGGGEAFDCTLLTSLGYNITGGPVCPDQALPSDIIADAMQLPLADNGGPTPTHALPAGSSAIDAADPGLSFATFDGGNIGPLQFDGFADVDEGTLILAGNAASFRVGSAFASNPINPTESFSAQFQFRVDPTAPDPGQNIQGGGADGVTFTIGNAAGPSTDVPTVVTATQNSIGSAGGFLGLAFRDLIEPGQPIISLVDGVSVEFDTWQNGSGEGANDINFVDPFNHIGININGNLSSIAATGFNGVPVLTESLSDGTVWTAWVDYDAADNLLEVRASTDGQRPAAATLSATVDIAALTGATAYVGFTGASGAFGISGDQRIVSFDFSSPSVGTCAAVDQRGVERPQGPRCDIGAYEADLVPAVLEEAGLQVIEAVLPGNDQTYPGVVDIPLIDIPIENLTGDAFSAPEAAPLSSFPLSSFPLSSLDLRASPLSSFPLSSFPLSSFDVAGLPLSSFPLSSLTLLDQVGGWPALLAELPDLAGAPPQNVTLEDFLNAAAGSPVLDDITLGSLSIEGSPLSSLSLPGLALGDTNVATLDAWAGSGSVCGDLLAEGFTDCDPNTDTLISLEIKGAPIQALSLSGLPLSSFPLSSFPLSSLPLSSFPLSSFPLSSFPLSSLEINGAPLSSFPLSSFVVGGAPLSSFDLLVAPLSSFPLSSFPLSSLPLSSFEVGEQSFCDFYDTVADATQTACATLVDPENQTILDLLNALLAEDAGATVASTPLSSFPLSSLSIANVPLSSFDVSAAAVAGSPLSSLPLSSFNACQIIDGTGNCSTVAGLNGDSTLLDVANVYGSLAASPLSSFPLSSLPLSSLPMSSFPLSSLIINAAPLSSFPLSSFDLVGSPLSSLPLSSLGPILDSTVDCSACNTLGDAAQASAVLATATLGDIEAAIAGLTLGQVLNSFTLEFLFGAGTFGDIDDLGDLTFGQLIVALMLKSDFPWETIPLDQLDPQSFTADNFVEYAVDFQLGGFGGAEVGASVTLPSSFRYVSNSATLLLDINQPAPSTELIGDPVIVSNEPASPTQTLTFAAVQVSAPGNHRVSFQAIPSIELGEFDAQSQISLNGALPVDISNTAANVTVVADPSTDADNVNAPSTTAQDVLVLGYISSDSDNDFFQVAAPQLGDRIAVFMANPANDYDLLLYRPATLEDRGQSVTGPDLDSVPIEDDGVDYEGNATEEPDPLEDVNLLNGEILAGISSNRSGDESVAAVVADGDSNGLPDPLTIQVSGYNGATSAQPYSLRFKVTPAVPVPTCTARAAIAGWNFSAVTTVAPAGQWTPNTNSVFLVNGNRLAASEGAAAADAALLAINELVTAPNVIDGVVVDVSTIPNVSYADWDSNPCDVVAANNIVHAITAYLEGQRNTSPSLTYITIVGSDEIIPFLRKPDETSIANESTFAAEYSDNAMFGSHVTRHFLTDDAYGDIDPIEWLDRFLNVPELAVGRLVESAADIQAAAQNYLSAGGQLAPISALGAGYDFIFDATGDINDTFDSYGFDRGTPPPDLNDPPQTPLANAWTRQDFLAAAGVTPMSTNVQELVSFNMHFDYDEALPSSGDASGDYSSNLITVNDFINANVDMTGRVWFTVGCHSGINLADVSVVGDEEPQDWAQTLNSLGAVYVGQAAYGLGDTVALSLSELLMANFARNLNGNMSAGQAHAFAKQDYFKALGLYGEYDYKAMQASVYYGLPMYQFATPIPVDDPLPPLTPVATDPLSGIASASFSIPDTNISADATQKGTLFNVDGSVQFVHYRPLQPIIGIDVTSETGEVARSAFITSLVTEDIPVADMAFARPVIDLGELEPEVETDEIVFPTAFTNVASFRVPGDGTPFEDRQQLNVIVGQYTSPADGQTSGTERLFRGLDVQVFYQDAPVIVALQAQTATSASAKQQLMMSPDYIRPELDNIQAGVVEVGSDFRATFSVTAKDVVNEFGTPGQVRRVAVLYRSAISGAFGTWELIDLVRGEMAAGGGFVWSGSGLVDPSGLANNGEVDYLVQAVDANGNVANSTFKGLFYTAEEEVTVDPGGGDLGIVITDGNGEEVDPGQWITDDPASIDVTNPNPTVEYEYSVDFGPFVPLPADGEIDIDGDGIHFVTIRTLDGSFSTTFVVLIDTTAPEIVLTSPVDGQYVVQTQEPAAEYVCRDAGSGVLTCAGPVASGDLVPSADIGDQTFTVNSTDVAGFSSEVSADYTVVKSLDLTGPVDPLIVGELVTVSGSASDLDRLTETATIDWGDGTVETLELVSSGDELTFEASHEYALAGAYQVIVSVDFAGEFLQQDSLSVGVANPTGLWAQGNDPTQAIWMAGRETTVAGLVHSNGGLRFTGNKHQVTGITRYVDVISGDNKVNFSSDPIQVEPAVWPFNRQLADYQPGGTAALEAGADFIDMSAECVQAGKWQITNRTPLLEPGLYWVPCDVEILRTLELTSISIVATGKLRVTRRQALDPFIDNVVFWSESSDSEEAIRISSREQVFGGFLFAPNGGIRVSGNQHRFDCGIAAQKIRISGSFHKIGKYCSLEDPRP